MIRRLLIWLGVCGRAQEWKKVAPVELAQTVIEIDYHETDLLILTFPVPLSEAAVERIGRNFEEAKKLRKHILVLEGEHKIYHIKNYFPIEIHGGKRE